MTDRLKFKSADTILATAPSAVINFPVTHEMMTRLLARSHVYRDLMAAMVSVPHVAIRDTLDVKS